LCEEKKGIRKGNQKSAKTVSALKKWVAFLTEDVFANNFWCRERITEKGRKGAQKE